MAISEYMGSNNLPWPRRSALSGQLWVLRTLHKESPDYLLCLSYKTGKVISVEGIGCFVGFYRIYFTSAITNTSHFAYLLNCTCLMNVQQYVWRYDHAWRRLAYVAIKYCVLRHIVFGALASLEHVKSMKYV